MLKKEISGKSEAGLFAASFISVIPSYISRSVAGSYDNEAIAIFALIFCFYLFIKALNTVSYIIEILIKGINYDINFCFSLFILYGS